MNKFSSKFNYFSKQPDSPTANPERELTLLVNLIQVHGLVRRSSSINTLRIQHLLDDGNAELQGKKLHLHYGDLTDADSLARVLAAVQPVEIYNMGAQVNVTASFAEPEYTADVNGVGMLVARHNKLS